MINYPYLIKSNPSITLDYPEYLNNMIITGNYASEIMNISIHI